MSPLALHPAVDLCYVENQVAMFLLPEGAAVGSRLGREVLEWSLV